MRIVDSIGKTRKSSKYLDLSVFKVSVGEIPKTKDFFAIEGEHQKKLLCPAHLVLREIFY